MNLSSRQPIKEIHVHIQSTQYNNQGHQKKFHSGQATLKKGTEIIRIIIRIQCNVIILLPAFHHCRMFQRYQIKLAPHHHVNKSYYNYAYAFLQVCVELHQYDF